jgi:hypothetical protein
MCASLNYEDALVVSTILHGLADPAAEAYLTSPAG